MNKSNKLFRFPVFHPVQTHLLNDEPSVLTMDDLAIFVGAKMSLEESQKEQGVIFC